MESPPHGKPRIQFSLRSLIVMMVALTILISFLVVAYVGAQQSANLTDCKGHQKQVTMYLQIYVSRFGSEVNYPTSTPPVGGVGQPIALGTNGAFWSHLWRLPATASLDARGENSQAVAHPRDGDPIFMCPGYRGECHRMSGGPNALDWSGPNLTNAAAFPGGVLSDRVRAEAFIGGDLLLAGDCNHGGYASGPNSGYSAMLFDGSVQWFPMGSPDQARYLAETDAVTGSRTR